MGQGRRHTRSCSAGSKDPRGLTAEALPIKACGGLRKIKYQCIKPNLMADTQNMVKPLLTMAAKMDCTKPYVSI